ncbi:MAG TPA: FAD-binding oxidoreductase [Candidatus Binataceae bacterium]
MADKAARIKQTKLSGWGRYPVCEAEVYRPEGLGELSEIVGRTNGHVLARGAGRAYGDAALSERGAGWVIDLTRLNRMLEFDPSSSVLRCEAGVTLAEIIDTFLPRGFFLPVTPGTKWATVGGSIAADVHGKNHHRDSSLSAHVMAIELMIASGERKRCSREENSDLFWATMGGMGLTGVIVEAEVRLVPVESAYVDCETLRAANADAALEAIEAGDEKYRYSVAWIDCAATGAGLGRSVISQGNFARQEQLDAKRKQEPLIVAPGLHAWLPFDLPRFALSRLTIRGFNSVIFAAHKRPRRGLAGYDAFFYPLDAIRSWNRMYGRRGFVQYQCVWPLRESRAGLIETVEAIARAGRGSFLTVLKKFGTQEGVLSFPMAGYTLALDFPLDRGLFDFLDQLDAMVLKRGGRVYLAKDARMKPRTMQAMYPNLGKWLNTKASIDPRGVFSSSLSRRLEIR